MDKVKELMKDKKKFGMIIGGIVAVIVVIVLLIVFVPKLGKEEDAQAKYERYLKEMGKDFWENYFYDTLKEDERMEFLNKFQSIGVKVDLDSLGRYNADANREKIEEFINPETKEACNHSTTRVIIYPKGNFTKTEYDLEVEIDCGFNQDNK